jgi:hypothetical protein
VGWNGPSAMDAALARGAGPTAWAGIRVTTAADSIARKREALVFIETRWRSWFGLRRSKFVFCGCDHETNYHNSESLFDRIKRFAVEGIGHGRVPRGTAGKHDRNPNGPAAMKMNPIV